LRRSANSHGSALAAGGPLALAAALLLCAASHSALAAKLTVKVTMPDGAPSSGFAVTAQTAGAEPAPPIKAIMDQIDRAFVPELIVVPVGSQVQFPNSDSVSHQVYSFSPIKRFQLPLYRGKPYPPVKFDMPGIATLGCNIHDYMQGFVLVTSAPYYGLTDKDGLWSRNNLPAGDYEISAWHPRMHEAPARLRRSVHLDANSTLEIQFALTEALMPPPLKSKDRQWDY
jgi:plastocyanin